MANNPCSQCGNEYKTCIVCGDRIIFVPIQGFGNEGQWRHLEPPRRNVRKHNPHPKLYVT